MAQEDFDLASLATYLHLTPEQVRKMADRDKIPGRKIGGVWKFSPAEIHQWFEERIGASDAKELVEVQKILDQQKVHQNVDSVRIAELLPSERIFMPFRAKTKNSVIDSICEMTSRSGVLWEPAKMAEAVRSREELHPTALENGVALLHPRRPIPGILGEPFLSLAVQTSGIPFGGPRGSLTDIFFLIGSVDEAFHLRLLARLSQLLQAPNFLDELRQLDDPAAAHHLVADYESQIDD